MSKFIKSLLKWAHPDNQESGDSENFIKIKRTIEKNNDIKLCLKYNIDNYINGYCKKIGDKYIRIKSGKIPDDKIYEIKTSDGNNIKASFKYDFVDEEHNVQLKIKDDKIEIEKILKINLYQKLFGDNITFDFYGHNVNIEINPCQEKKIKKNIKIGLKLFSIDVKLVCEMNDRDKEFLEKIKMIYQLDFNKFKETFENNENR